VNGCEFSIAVSALASAFAAQIEDDEDLNVLAAAVTQFGDSLALIAAWRARCAAIEAKQAAEEESQKTEEAGADAEPVIQ